MNEEKNIPNYGLLPQYRVDGFDPNDVLVKIEDTDENGQTVEFLYMDHAAASQWFYTVFPNGAINHKLEVLNDRKATVTAFVYRDANDAHPAATGLATRYFSEDIHGRNYEQNAVTAAIRKALGYLGFGTPLDAHVTEKTRVRKREDVPERSEPGVPVLRPALPKLNEELPFPEETKKEASAPANQAPANKPEAQEAEAPAPKKRGRKPANAAPAPTPDPVKAPPAETEAAAEPKAEATPKAETKAAGPLSLEAAASFRFPYGSCAGMTIDEAAKLKGNDFIRYHCERAVGDFKNALSTYCEYKGC